MGTTTQIKDIHDHASRHPIPTGKQHNGNKAITLDDIRSALMNEFHCNTSLTDREQFQQRQREQHIYDITQQGFDWLVTLTFKYKKTDHDKVVSLGKIGRAHV